MDIFRSKFHVRGIKIARVVGEIDMRAHTSDGIGLTSHNSRLLFTTENLLLQRNKRFLCNLQNMCQQKLQYEVIYSDLRQQMKHINFREL